MPLKILLATVWCSNEVVGLYVHVYRHAHPNLRSKLLIRVIWKQIVCSIWWIPWPTRGPSCYKHLCQKKTNVSVQQAASPQSTWTWLPVFKRNTQRSWFEKILCVYIYAQYIYKAVIFHKAVIFQLLWLAPHGSFFSFLLLPVRLPWKQVSSAPMCVHLYIYIYIYIYIIIHIKTNINK